MEVPAPAGRTLARCLDFVGLVVAAIYDYFDSLSTAGRILTAIAAVLLWPLLLFDFDIRIQRRARLWRRLHCYRRLDKWQRAGVWERLHELLLARLRAAGEIEWPRAVADSSHVQAKKMA